nr:MAG TPA: hypothetical protein [Inoviridae sp.]
MTKVTLYVTMNLKVLRYYRNLMRTNQRLSQH